MKIICSLELTTQFMKNVFKKKNGGGMDTCTVLILKKIRSSKYFIFLFLHDHYFCCHYGLLQMAKDKTSLKIEGDAINQK